MKILILASNPRKDLNLDHEIRDLKDVIEKSRNRQEFEVEDALAVRVGDLQNLLFRYRPQIVHFCGHGSGQQGLVFEGNDGGEQWVRAEALSEMFRLFAKDVGCVLLNACYSEEQADAIVCHIDYVIGVKQEIRDDAAIAFSKGFYRALGYECSVEQAFEFGRNAIQLEISGSSKVRSAVTEAVRKAEVVEAIGHTTIPEHLKPVLKIKSNLTQSLRTNTTVPAQPLSPETRVTIQLDIDQSLEADAKVKQYRDRVREFLSDRKLSALEIIRLERLRKDLGLSEAEANRILTEEQEPIRQAQDEYEAMLIDLIGAGHYPLDAAMRQELQAARQELGLTDEEVDTIETPILAAAEEDYQARLVEEQRQRAQQQQALEQQRLEEQRREEEARRRSLALEQQRLEEQRQTEEARRRSLLKSFEFQIATVKVGSKTIEKPGLFGKKTETINTCNIIYEQGKAEYFAEDLSGGVTLEMVAIAGGKFMMGSPNNELERGNDENPQHNVTIQPFLMGKFTVTQAQWRSVAALSKINLDLQPDPSSFKGSNLPVEQVSWAAAVEFCDRLSQKTGRNYRLPSEAEWEYACRAGTKTPFYFGETITPELANYNGSFIYGLGSKGLNRNRTTEVGSFPANAFGLYDMHGNVWEWCEDDWHGSYEGAPCNGNAWMETNRDGIKLLRGGSWYDAPEYCRSADRINVSRDGSDGNVGFRVCCVPPRLSS